MAIKLVAIDLDGTLFNQQKEISKRNREALKRIEANGIKVVICTGRPLIAIQPVLQLLDLNKDDDYSITFNGGLIQHNASGDILEKLVLQKADVQNIYQLAEKLELPLDAVSNDVVYQLPGRTPSLYSNMNRQMTFLDCTSEQLNAKIDYNKVLLSQEPEQLDAKIPAVLETFGDRYRIMKTQPFLLELAHPNVGKAHGLEVLGQHLGIQPSEMMALGDEENDLDMLQYAGVGVAMGNASQAAKDAADVVTLTNEEDGVAYALEKWMN